jgi:hypothetical protein
MSNQPSRRLPARVMVPAAVLLAVPIIALLLVPTYAKKGPELWGFPFFYWYQLLWVFLAAMFTCAAYLLISRSRRPGGDR